MPLRRQLAAREEPGAYAGDDDGDRDAERTVLDVYVGGARGVEVDGEVEREHHHRGDGGDGGHRHAERQIGVEQETPPVAVAAPGRGRREQQDHRLDAPVGVPGAAGQRREVERLDGTEPEEREHHELPEKAERERALLLELLPELGVFHRAREPEDEQEQQHVRHRRARDARVGRHRPRRHAGLAPGGPLNSRPLTRVSPRSLYFTARSRCASNPRARARPRVALRGRLRDETRPPARRARVSVASVSPSQPSPPVAPKPLRTQKAPILGGDEEIFSIHGAQAFSPAQFSESARHAWERTRAGTAKKT